MNILIVGPSWVGDMVMAQSLFMALKSQHPNANIDVLAPAWSRPIIEAMPEVRAAIDMPVGHGALQLGLGVLVLDEVQDAGRHQDHAQAVQEDLEQQLHDLALQHDHRALHAQDALELRDVVRVERLHELRHRHHLRVRLVRLALLRVEGVHVVLGEHVGEHEVPSLIHI